MTVTTGPGSQTEPSGHPCATSDTLNWLIVDATSNYGSRGIAPSLLVESVKAAIRASIKQREDERLQLARDVEVLCGGAVSAHDADLPRAARQKLAEIERLGTQIAARTAMLGAVAERIAALLALGRLLTTNGKDWIVPGPGNQFLRQ